MKLSRMRERPAWRSLPIAFASIWRIRSRVTLNSLPTSSRVTSPVMTVEELSAYLRIHPTTLYRMIRKRQIPVFRVGSNHRFNRQAIDEWRRAQEVKSAAPAQELQPALPAQPSRRGRGRPPRVNKTSLSPS